MQRIRQPLSWLLLGVGLVLELMLLTALANEYRSQGHEFGRWAVRMGADAAQAVSWLVVIAVGVAFVAFWAALRIWVMLGIIVAALLIELWWGRELPPPQNHWGYALAFLLGAFAMFVQAILRTDFIQRAQALWGRIRHT